jgi:Zn-dependent M28 family amino/carboxypeptidase
MAHCRDDRFASGFFNPGMAVVDSVLPVSGIDGSAVSLSPFYAQS